MAVILSSVNSLSKHVMNAIIVLALFVLSFQLVEFLVVSIQNTFTGTEFASLLFLPHGVRILTVILYGARSGFSSYSSPAHCCCS